MKYHWIYLEKAPKLLLVSRSLIGVSEYIGNKNNPTILEWAREVGLSGYYTNDNIPWCGLFIAYCCHKANLPICKQPLWARNWATWGNAATLPMLGDILVFGRKGGGHVGIYIGEDSSCYHVLGGNQNNQVNIVRILKGRLIAARRTPWRIAQPTTVRRVLLSPSGRVSENEA